MVKGSDSRSAKQIENRCRRLGIPRLDLVPEMISAAAACRIELDAARSLRAVPVSEEDGQVTVAMADPTDREAVAQIAQLIGAIVVPVYCPPQAIEAGLLRLEQMRLEV